MHEFLNEYLASHGYWVIFVWTFLEGEAGLILAGFLAFQGYFNILGVISTAFVGSFLGDQFYFYLGRYKGPLLLKIFTSIARKFKKALKLIERYGNFVAFASRYTYGFRIILPIILGMTNLSSYKFASLNLFSALTWSILFSLIGYFFGKTATLFIKDMSRYEHYLVLLLIGLIGCMWLFHFVHIWIRKKPALARLKKMKSSRISSK